MKPFYADLHKISEDDRITLIGQAAMKNPGRRVGIVVDDEPGKPERYIEKLTKQFPLVSVVERAKGPTPGAVTIIVSAKGQDRGTGLLFD